MEFSKEIITVLDYLCSKFGIAIDWTSQNVMPYLESLCEKYIKYEVFTSIAWIVIVVAVTGIIAIPLSITHKKASASRWCDNISMAAITFWVLFVAMAIISVLVVCTQVFDIIECYTIPEKTILEYLKYLMNTVSN